jgi:SHS2 domain-containing protein
MPYHYLEDIGTADIAFEATGRDLPELFIAAADATMNVMIDNLDAIESRETRQIELSNDNIEILLFDFLQELPSLCVAVVLRVAPKSSPPDPFRIAKVDNQLLGFRPISSSNSIWIC